MNINDVTQLAGRHKRRKRLGRGRGSGHGKTSGRGHKGGGSRAGWTQRGMAEGGQMPLFRRLPKRGFSNVNFRTDYSVVNVRDLEARFDDGAHVTAQALAVCGLIRDPRFPVKVLGDGTLSKKLRVEANRYSQQAREKITAAGGEARLISGLSAAPRR